MRAGRCTCRTERLFGAVYANLAPRLPLPSWARGPVAASAENIITWPLTALTDRLHPARKELPSVFANPRAFAQSTWRHLLFGVLLGELEAAPERRKPAGRAGAAPRDHRCATRSVTYSRTTPLPLAPESSAGETGR